ncbi:MAG: methionyl-tRNA formyltransferase [Clostridia bacterium]|nr:methionyl-tRNA formyltransferase [Clostridia bacterium]
MKIMFMGTPDFAVECLKSLINAGHNIVSVVTTPDKPRGRGHKLCPTKVGEFADENNIKVYKPINLKKENFHEILQSENPEVIIVVAYGRILPPYVLEFPEYGCINVHASLLPKYRGAAPIQRSIIDGEKITGVTTMYMAEGLDTGDMLLKSEVTIDGNDNFETLHDKLALSGAKLIVETLAELQNGNLNPQKQDDSESCYAHMITKETALIDWSESDLSIHNLVRGLFPVPKAYTIMDGKLLKICRTELCDMKGDNTPGKVISVANDCFYVSCGNSTVLKVLTIQAEGKKVMDVKDYLRGNTIEQDVILGGQ